MLLRNMYVVRHSEKPNVYWNKSLGWVDFNSAGVFWLSDNDKFPSTSIKVSLLKLPQADIPNQKKPEKQLAPTVLAKEAKASVKA